MFKSTYVQVCYALTYIKTTVHRSPCTKTCTGLFGRESAQQCVLHKILYTVVGNSQQTTYFYTTRNGRKSFIKVLYWSFTSLFTNVSDVRYLRERLPSGMVKYYIMLYSTARIRLPGSMSYTKYCTRLYETHNKLLNFILRVLDVPHF